MCFTGYSVFPDGTVMLSRLRKFHLNKERRAQHSSKSTEKPKDFFPSARDFPESSLHALFPGNHLSLAKKQKAIYCPKSTV